MPHGTLFRYGVHRNPRAGLCGVAVLFGAESQPVGTPFVSSTFKRRISIPFTNLHTVLTRKRARLSMEPSAPSSCSLPISKPYLLFTVCHLEIKLGQWLRKISVILCSPRIGREDKKHNGPCASEEPGVAKFAQGPMWWLRKVFVSACTRGDTTTTPSRLLAADFTNRRINQTRVIRWQIISKVLVNVTKSTACSARNNQEKARKSPLRNFLFRVYCKVHAVCECGCCHTK